ncbi:hypothetical protein LSH36_3079g00000 [Paralvinella palmiformis]|uniref:C2H2-type domain-containing protein n=1 Tax=Paralvinella palmiformis TaxID=53620 RepID=A0AAD9IQZ3_9ANNE|nr:hypothetical protein LSH36_3079g00000 [Paralvinella palmiformis]
MEAGVCLTCNRIKSVFVCPFENCTKTFSKKSRLTHHVMTHTGEVRILIIIFVDW